MLVVEVNFGFCEEHVLYFMRIRFQCCFYVGFLLIHGKFQILWRCRGEGDAFSNHRLKKLVRKEPNI